MRRPIRLHCIGGVAAGGDRPAGRDRAESFFATLECELLDRTRWATHAEARSAVFAFIEGWYNTRRRHSALGYLSPLDFERLRETAPADGDRSGEALAPAGRVASGAPAPSGVVTGVAAGNTGRA